jgi:hypothetical protein
MEAARNIHNQTAGNPQGVAAAKSLGDLSHMVYVPVTQNGHGTGEFLILDLWNSVEGLNKFFSDPQVHEGGNMIFKQRDPVVSMPAEGFTTYHIPAPHGKNTRVVSTVRGTVKSHDEAKAVHNELVGKLINKTRSRGNLSHEAYFRLAEPGTPESLEFFGVDVWMDAAGMNEHYNDPEFLGGFQKLFTGMPATGIWTHPAGEWVEW